jgi:tRNA (guanine-N7-)-methyltransferase
MEETRSPDRNEATRAAESRVEYRVEIPAATLEGLLDWREVFGNSGPVELEIGFGKGTFLREAAQMFPDRNYLGLERANKYFRLVRGRLEKRGLENVRIVRGEALHFLTHFIPDDSLQAIHIYHPDPWPKRRHHKRRLLTRDFLALCLSKLVEGGGITITTDFEKYFDFIREEVQALHRERGGIEYEEGRGPGIVMTNFARKHLERGATIFRMEITNLPGGVTGS